MSTASSIIHDPRQDELVHDLVRLKWVPIDATIKNGRPVVEWLDMSEIVFSEPFFQQTVDRARKRIASSAVFTDLDALIQFEKISDHLEPSGLIFHSSRCGSTLLANACKAIRNSIVVAEAPVVDKLLSRFLTDVGEGATKELLYSAFVRGAIHALGQRRMKTERYYFVKFSSASTLQFSAIRRIWPRVPAVFLYREPVEVMVSNLQTVPAWMIAETNPSAAAAIVGVTEQEVAQLSREEFCARALGRYYSVVEAITDEHTWLINYDELSADQLLRIISFFGVNPSAQEAQDISETVQVYSKGGRTSFKDDRQDKRANASATVKEMAEKWAMPAYQRLESKGSRTAAGTAPLTK